MLYGYCIRRAGEPGPDAELRGLEAAAVLLLEEGGVGLWYSELSDPPRRDPARMRAHDAVVRAALRSATPLPLRFAARFDDEEAARAFLRQRADAFLADLERIGDRVEMGVRVVRDPASSGVAEGGGAGPVIRSGREYLEARRREIRGDAEARSLAVELLDRVEAAVRELEPISRRHPATGGEALALVAHLVHRKQVRGYRERVRALQHDSRGLAIVLSGPWAPYSFV